MSAETHDASAGATVPRRRSWLRWIVRKIALYAAIIYLALAALVTIFQRSMLFVPTCVAKMPAAHLPHADVQSVRITAADGLPLNGWWIGSRRELRPADNGAPRAWRLDKPLVLYFCGNAGNRAHRMGEWDLLTALGADVLCFDYRGYGENPGSPSEKSLIADAREAWRFATEERHVDPSRIVIMGESLGGGVATALAADVCSDGTPPAGLILRSTFSSAVDVAQDTLPWLPVRYLMRDPFPSTDRIPRVTCPILMVHGCVDTIVPCRFGQRLFAAAPEHSSNGIAKRFVELPRADHNDILDTEGALLRQSVQEFLEQVCPIDARPVARHNDPMFESLLRFFIYPAEKARDISPRAAGLPADRFHPIEVATDDGLTLHGWHALAAGHSAADRAACDRELAAGRPLALFFCGNGGNRAYRIPEIATLTEAGADVFIFDYRGYGDNAGEPSEKGIAADARAIWRYATEERGVSSARIILYGESLGGAVATRLAAERCAAGTQPAGLLLRSTFTSLVDIARVHYRGIPGALLSRLLANERYASIERIGQVTCPILILHGRNDAIAPLELGRRLFDAAPEQATDGTPKRFVDLPHADHNDVLDTDGALLRESVRTFLSERGASAP